MRKSTKKIIGYVLIILGIGIPLIGFSGMAWNILWAKSEYKSFQSTYRSQPREVLSALEEELIAYNENIKAQHEMTVVDPFTANGFETEYNVEDISDGGVFAFLVIPKLGLTKPIYLGATYEHLGKGVAHIDGTNIPMGGEGTRSVIAGHRGFYSDTMFLNIDDLEDGDIFYIDRGEEQLVYEVRGKEVIGPSDWDKLDPQGEDDMVTLLTCHPFAPPRPYRLLVNGYRLLPEVEGRDIEAYVSELTSGTEIDQTSRYMNIGICVVAAIGWVALLWYVVKLVKYMLKRNLA